MLEEDEAPCNGGHLVVALRGKRLAEACAHRGWSFSYLAARAHVSRPTLAAAVRGRRIRPSTAWKIAHALSEAPVPSELSGLMEDH